MSKEVRGRMAGQTLRLRLGDCVEVMKSLPESSVGAVVCDPPYG
jgi:DNA modification methylase